MAYSNSKLKVVSVYAFLDFENKLRRYIEMEFEKANYYLDDWY
jgi:hypothetical protein